MSFQDKLIKQFGRAPNANNKYVGEMDVFERYKKGLEVHTCWMCGVNMYPYQYYEATNTTVWNCPTRLCPNNVNNTLKEEGIRDLTELNELLPWNTDRLWQKSINEKSTIQKRKIDDYLQYW